MPSRQSWEPAGSSIYTNQISTSTVISASPIILLGLLCANRTAGTLNVQVKDGSAVIASLQVPAGDSRNAIEYPGLRVQNLVVVPSGLIDVAAFIA